MLLPVEFNFLNFSSHEMIIVLPHDKLGLPELMEKIYDPHHSAHFLEIIKKEKYSQDRVELTLPKFVLGGGASIDMKAPLSKMGFGRIFDQGKAEFDRITEKEKVYVSAVVHKAMIEVSLPSVLSDSYCYVGVLTVSDYFRSMRRVQKQQPPPEFP